MGGLTIRRRDFLKGAAALAALPSLESFAGDVRPNIVFILVDDLRWDALGLFGRYPFLKTPAIDRIGREGAVFANAFVTTPLCSPSRASFLTGKYPHAHGIVGNEIMQRRNFAKDDTLVTFPRLLQAAGYQTAHVGKWHMDPSDNPRPGFDHWVSFRGQGAYNDGLFNVDGKAVKTSGYVSDVLTDYADTFIRKPRAANKPWALTLWHKAVHGPFTPAARHQDLFASDVVPRASAARSQLRTLLAVEESTAKVLAALEETKQRDNTMVVFSSDNGYFWGEHGLGDKRWAYEESIRVPLLVRYPARIRPGTQPGALALNIDLAPTFLDFAGEPIPAGMHGRSLVPDLTMGAAPGRPAVLLEYFHEARFPKVPDWQAVRTPRHKLVVYPDKEQPDALFDLQADPLEQKNLCALPDQAATVRALRADLDRLKNETKWAPVPKKNKTP